MNGFLFFFGQDMNGLMKNCGKPLHSVIYSALNEAPLNKLQAGASIFIFLFFFCKIFVLLILA